MSITIYDIAKAANVSITTVSKIMNNKSTDISDKTREVVLKTMEEMHYKPSNLARSMVTKRTGVIGLLIPDISNPYFSEIARGVEDSANNRNFNVIFCDTDESPKKELEYMNILEKRQIDGVIFIPTAESPRKSIQNMAASQKPFVVVDRVFDDRDANMFQVFVNNMSGGYMAAQYLAKKGHRRIGCVTGSHNNKSSQDRLAGYKKALGEADIPMEPSLIYEGNYRYSSGVDAGEYLLQKEVTAIFIENDVMASGVYAALAEHNVAIPRDISVVGYDDINLSKMLSPQLTTIQQPKLEMGRAAAEMLIHAIKRENGSHLIGFEPKLIERKSVRPL